MHLVLTDHKQTFQCGSQERYPVTNPDTFNIKMNKTNRCTEFQLYWYDDSTCFGQPFYPSSGVLRRTSALVHYVQLW